MIKALFNLNYSYKMKSFVSLGFLAGNVISFDLASWGTALTLRLRELVPNAFFNHTALP